MSEKMPKSVLKKMSMLARHLQSDSYTIRCALVETIGNLIAHHLMFEETDSARRQMDGLLDILEERFRDVSSYVRAKVLQVVGYLCELKAILLRRRFDLLELILDRIRDKSSHVRRKAIQNLIVFIRTHPFSKDGGELKLSFFQKRLEELAENLKSFSRPPTELLESDDVSDTHGSGRRSRRIKMSEDSEEEENKSSTKGVALETTTQESPILEDPIIGDSIEVGRDYLSGTLNSY